MSRDQAGAGLREERVIIRKFDKTTTTASEDTLTPIEEIEVVDGRIVRHEVHEEAEPCH